MPTEGTIVKARDVGKTGGRYIYTACQECGNSRWVAWAKHNRSPMICKKCSDFKKGLKRRITFILEKSSIKYDFSRIASNALKMLRYLRNKIFRD